MAMDPRSDVELLEFPCRFPVKVMGANDSDFREHARALVEAHAGPVPADRIESRTSRNGRFLSVTLHVQAQSREQLDAIYTALTSSSRVLMAL